jgi:gamma-glutamyl:cysteine ligase YbdK (ATP-grasp superfamily)
VGLPVDRDHFEERDFVRFRERLTTQLEVLAELVARPGFGGGPASVGAELEMSLVDAQGRPALVNEQVLASLGDPRFTEELNRFNVECNATPFPLAGHSLTALEEQLGGAVQSARRAAAAEGARVALIGILPTLEAADLDPGVMTDRPRYRALSAGLKRQRRGLFALRIDGEDPLEMECEDVTFEGANTSLQLHLKVPPEAFGRTHDAVQLATGPTLAMSGNSPTFLGHRLWDETRIALFKQTVDARSEHDPPPRVARVSFGTGWASGDPIELFVESVRLHEPLLPVLGTEDAVARARAGLVPELGELRLHHGTVWQWNRAVYDSAGGGHLRIEMRALPAGPTLADMLANAAFLLGLSLDLAADSHEFTSSLPFAAAEENFYRAAQQGPDARLHWLDGSGTPVRLAARQLVPELVDRAAAGLAGAGVDAADATRLLEIFKERARTGRTGARWQRAGLKRFGGTPEARGKMFQAYMDRSESGAPVHTWGDP